MPWLRALGDGALHLALSHPDVFGATAAVNGIFDVEAWVDWAQSAGLHPIGTAFMLFRRELLSTFDPANAEKAFATPRTWVKALRYYASNMSDNIKAAAICGAVDTPI